VLGDRLHGGRCCCQSIRPLSLGPRTDGSVPVKHRSRKLIISVEASTLYRESFHHLAPPHLRSTARKIIPREVARNAEPLTSALPNKEGKGPHLPFWKLGFPCRVRETK
jgi:hypothetical protein